MPLQGKKISQLLGLLVGVMFLAAYKTPEFYRKTLAPALDKEHLDYVVVAVGDEKRLVKEGETLVYIRGETLKVIAAALKSGSQKVGEINVVGFHHQLSQGQGRDDTGLPIDTAKFLIDGHWAVDGKGKVFAVAVASSKILHGFIYLQRLDPQLRYVDVRVNQQLRVMREGELLRVQASDQFKVDKVVTNLKNHENVSFHIVALAKTSDRQQRGRGLSNYEIRFQHHAYMFGKIPLLVER